MEFNPGGLIGHPFKVRTLSVRRNNLTLYAYVLQVWMNCGHLALAKEHKDQTRMVWSIECFTVANSAKYT